MKSLFEQMGVSYHTAEDGLCYPDITLATPEKASYGKYGSLREHYLKEYKRGLYLSLLASGKLTEHLNRIDALAREQVSCLVRQMAEKQGVTESLKAADQMAWVGAMNNIKHSAEEIVQHDLLYV